MSPPPAPRLPQLPWSDGIRGVALILVVTWHAVLTVVPSDPTPAQHVLMLPLGIAARLSLLSFIVLSGYLLGRHWDGDLRRFWVRRCWRILPPYWIAVLLTVVAMVVLGLRHAEGSHWDSSLPFTWGRSLATFFLVTDVAQMTPISHPLWTVPVEFHLYLLAPLIVLLKPVRSVLLVGVAGTLAIALLAPGFVAPHFVLAFMASFWLGVRRPAPLDRWRSVALLASFLLVIVVVLVAGDLSRSATRYLVVDCLVAPVLLVWMLRGDVGGEAAPSRLRSVLTGRAFVWLGTRSFSIYLLHAVALELLWRGGVDRLPDEMVAIAAMCVLGFGASVLVGEVLFRTVEAPSAARSAAVRRTLPRERRPA